ncbi:MAG: efflux transporter outer membrane subunit, partial [Pseudomonadota bacterium]|nr:efflux transporter outer membrane subunit [Pseudomonadota bacterium]
MSRTPPLRGSRSAMRQSRKIDCIASLAMTALLASCSLVPAFKPPAVMPPASYKEQPAGAEVVAMRGRWQAVHSLEKENRGQWWKIFDDPQLNDLEQQAEKANPSLQASAARVAESRDIARANVPSLLPDIGIGGNAVRAQPAAAGLAAFGQPGKNLHPYTLYAAQGEADYEADLFGQVRANYKAFLHDADAMAAAYRSALLALQADVAQDYFGLRTLDAERQTLRDAVAVRKEAARIMQARFNQGDAGKPDMAGAESALASAQAGLLALDRGRAAMEHALAVLLGKLPSTFMLAENPLAGNPPQIPPGLPSQLLARRPDVAEALSSMAAANARVGAARAAFFPSLMLTATGGYESTGLSDLLRWSNRTWALGQLSGLALSMPIFDNGRNQAQLAAAHAAYDEAVANYHSQVLIAFRDVEDNLAAQRLLAGQAERTDEAAASAEQVTGLTRKRYDAGDADYSEVVTAEQQSLTDERAAAE